MTQPQLLTKRLLLRPIAAEDTPQVQRMVDDAEFTRQEGRLSAELFMAEFPSRMWLAELRDTGEAVGLCAFLAPTPQGVLMSYSVLSDHGGVGYGFEIAARLKRHGEEDLKVRVLARCAMDNPNSQRILVKLGYVRADPPDITSHNQTRKPLELWVPR